MVVVEGVVLWTYHCHQLDSVPVLGIMHIVVYRSCVVQWASNKGNRRHHSIYLNASIICIHIACYCRLGT